MNQLVSNARIPRRLSVLVVDPAPVRAVFSVSTLSAAGFSVATASSFHEARDRIRVRPPRVLLTELRLGEYNGLHLVQYANSSRTPITPIVIGTKEDAGLQVEAEVMGATFVFKPTSTQELLAAIVRTIWRTPGDRPIRRPFERRGIERRGTGAAAAPASERRRPQDRRGTVQRLLRPDVSSYGA